MPLLTPGSLVDPIYTCLSVEDPDVEGLAAALQAQTGLPPGDVRQLIYRTVRQINAALFPPLTKIEIIHTEGCNLACGYCFEKTMLGVRRMPADVARAAVNLLFDYAGDEPLLTITHFGGEPLLNLRAVRLVTEYAEERGRAAGKTVAFNMTSNGLLLTEPIADYLAAHKINVLLSIDGLAPSHDRYRRDRQGRATFDRVLRGLATLKRRQPWIGAKMTVMPENAAHLCADVRGLYAMGVNQFIVGEATGVPWGPAELAAFEEQLDALYAWYAAARPPDLRISEFEERDPEAPVWGCQAGRDSVAVSAGGEISPCSKILALNNRQLLARLGDARFGLTHLQNRRELLACDRLSAVWALTGAPAAFWGGCFASNYDENRDLYRPSLDKYAFAQLWRRVRGRHN